MATKRIAVKCSVWACAAGLLWGAGCGPTGPQSVRSIYRPGAKLLLTYDHKFVDKTSRYTEFAELELPVSVGQPARPGEVALRVTARRFVGGYSYVNERGEEHVERADSATGGRAKHESDRDVRERAESVKRFAVEATLDARGEVVDFTDRRPGIEGLVRELQAGADSPRERKWVPHRLSGAYLSLLGDSLAYLPPDGVRVGRRWPVRRALIFPLHEYAFAMATGAIAVSEEATCRLASVRETPAGRIARIRIRGRRSYHPARWGWRPRSR